MKRIGMVFLVSTFLIVALPLTAGATSADPESVDFGDVPIGTTATRDVTLTLGDGYRVIERTLSSPWGLDMDTCSGFVGPGTCNIRLSFTPAAAGGFSFPLNVTECPSHDGPCDSVTIALRGNGVSTFDAQSRSIDFGNVELNTTSTRDVTVTVDARYEIHTLSTFNPFSWASSETTCLKDGRFFFGPGTCNVRVGFRPVETGPASGTLTIRQCNRDATGVCYEIIVQLRGTGVLPPADLAVSIGAPNKPVSAMKPVTFTILVRNLGPNSTTAFLTNELPSGSRFVSATTSQGTCSTPPVGTTGTMNCSLGILASGSTATVTVTVKPAIKRGTLSDTASVSSGAATTDVVSSNNSATATVQVR